MIVVVLELAVRWNGGRKAVVCLVASWPAFGGDAALIKSSNHHKALYTLAARSRGSLS